jgi:hypothetical protein
METKTLYNLLRFSSLRDPTVSAEAWQVADYRQMSLEAIFQALNQREISLDRISFTALADEIESPEELTDYLIAERSLDAQTHDQIYLLLFELWRRFEADKLCLSVFCDELDYQIDLYDRGELTDSEPLEDALSNLTLLLEDNTEEKSNPKEVFELIGNRCANDLEMFLYDFMTDQIENKDVSYAAELLEDFGLYVKDSKWFELLKARILSFTDIPQANILIRKLMRRLSDKSDLEFNMEVLSVFLQGCERDLFFAIVNQTLLLLQTEEEFQDLLAISADYFHFIDEDQQETALLQILKERSKIPLEQPLQRKHPHLTKFTQIVNLPLPKGQRT